MSVRVRIGFSLGLVWFQIGPRYGSDGVYSRFT